MFCNQFFQSGKLPRGINETQLVMIPSKAKLEPLNDMRRLIALCNVLYKIAAKVLANHLKAILGELISEA